MILTIIVYVSFVLFMLTLLIMYQSCCYIMYCFASVHVLYHGCLQKMLSWKHVMLDSCSVLFLFLFYFNLPLYFNSLKKTKKPNTEPCAGVIAERYNVMHSLPFVCFPVRPPHAHTFLCGIVCTEID